MTRIQCPKCGSTNTWAHYVHDPCPSSPTGKTEWEAEANGATPTGRPVPLPCPMPNDGTMCPAPYTACRTCGNQW